MKKTVITVLVVVAVVLALVVAGAVGFIWYRDNHIFVDGKAYPNNAAELDLREEEITIEHYNALRAQLPNCKILWNVPFQDGAFANDTTGVSVSTLTEEDVAVMKAYFPALKTVDASDCQDYAALEYLKEQLPEVDVTYTVTLGGKSFDPDTTELVLENGDYDLAVMKENLIYLHSLTSIKLRTPELTTEQVEQLRAAFPDIAITCTALIFGQEYDTETTELDLSAMTGDDAVEVAQQLALLPNLTYVNLNPENGVGALSKEDVKLLMEAVPNVVFDFSFDFFGTTVSTADEEVVVTNTSIGDENESEVRLTLDLLTNCKRFVLDSCKLSDEVMEQIRNDYRGRTKVVWRVWFGGGSSLTDAEVIRCTYDLVDDNCHDLVYCEDVRFVDFGHNEWLDACDFVAGMTSLEYCILSGAPIKDLTPFSNCKNLKFLEIAFCEYVTDLSPLAECTNLQMLNISNTHALDLSPLDDLPLTHFCARLNPSGKSRISTDEQARFLEQHPDCWTSFDGAQPYGVGWRYDEDEITPLPQYALIQEAFHYPHAPNNTGWSLSEEALAMIADMEPSAEETLAEDETVQEAAVEETAAEEESEA